MSQNSKKFARIAESLRQYRRAELKDFENEIEGNPIESLYIDALPDDAVLQTVLSSSTTFLLGRKGTGKSTVFAKAQSEIRKRKDLISIYIDVKSLYETISASEVPTTDIEDSELSTEILRTHLLRKSFLGAVLSEVVKELREVIEKMSIWDRWLGKKWDYNQLIDKISGLAGEVRKVKLTSEEIPILHKITEKTKNRNSYEETKNDSLKTGAKASGLHPSLSLEAQYQDIDKTLSDNEVYREYSDVILRSFPFISIIEQVRDILDEAGLKRLIIFFDDFSEIEWINQKLFVDVILSPLNNTSDERVKLKVAGYPGRIYYGKIDPSKIDTLSLDFYSLYKDVDIQSAEESAVNYTTRLIEKRFSAFGENFGDYIDSSDSLSNIMRLLFETTLNVPRLMGYVLHNCYLDRVSKGLPITPAALRLASLKYYENVVALYFDRMNRFALEPFERKLDRHNQQELLRELVTEARNVRRRISTGEIGGTYFNGLTNPPASHFAVSPNLEKVLSSLELNFLVTKYHDMRDKDGNDVSIYALFYGLCESEKIPWGYPRGRRDDRSYFVQRSFNYSRTIHQFLLRSRTIRCLDCSASFPMDRRESFELFNWQCPECKVGTCSMVVLGDEFRSEVETLNDDLMLEKVELEILETLHDEGKKMRAKEISALINTTYQLVGKRTTKLQQMNLVDKSEIDGDMRNSITDRAKSIYFDE
jgi:hypothetical protein